MTSANIQKPSGWVRFKTQLRRQGIASWVALVVMLGVALTWLFPLYMAVINAVKTPVDFIQHGSLSLPTTISFDAIVKFSEDVNFGQKVWNSIQMSFFIALIGVIISFLNAYALGIGKVKGRMVILSIFMIAFTIPQEGLIYPLYQGATAVGLYDSIWSVIIVNAVLMSAFGTYMLSSVLSTFPEEILEAAKIDGAGSARMLFNIVLPIIRPTIMVLATLFFIWSWNDFLFPLVLLPSNDNQTVALALGVTTGQWTSDPTTKAAAALVGLLPSVIFFVIFQRTLMRGVAVGAVK
jgi:raffinose/stachyose/melibiose transport system permease protein